MQPQNEKMFFVKKLETKRNLAECKQRKRESVLKTGGPGFIKIRFGRLEQGAHKFIENIEKVER